MRLRPITRASSSLISSSSSSSRMINASASLQNSFQVLVLNWINESAPSLYPESSPTLQCSVGSILDHSSVSLLGENPSCLRSETPVDAAQPSGARSITIRITLGSKPLLIPGSFVSVIVDSAAAALTPLKVSSASSPPSPLAAVSAYWRYPPSSQTCEQPSHMDVDASGSQGLAGRHALFNWRISSGQHSYSRSTETPFLREGIHHLFTSLQLGNSTSDSSAAGPLTYSGGDVISFNISVLITNAFNRSSSAHIDEFLYTLNAEDRPPQLSLPAHISMHRSQSLRIEDTVIFPSCAASLSIRPAFSYEWTIISASSGSLSFPASVRMDTPTLRIPSNTLESQAVYVLKLSVSKEETIVASRTTEVQVLASPVLAFVDFTDQTVSTKAPLLLDASNSFDTEGKSLTFRWTCFRSTSVDDDEELTYCSEALEDVLTSSTFSVLEIPENTLVPSTRYRIQVNASTQEALPRFGLSSTTIKTAADSSSDSSSAAPRIIVPTMALDVRLCTPLVHTGTAPGTPRMLCSIDAGTPLVVDAMVWFFEEPHIAYELHFQWSINPASLDLELGTLSASTLRVPSDILEELPQNFLLDLRLDLEVKDTAASAGDNSLYSWNSASVQVLINIAPSFGHCGIMLEQLMSEGGDSQDDGATADETALLSDSDVVINATAFESSIVIQCQDWVAPQLFEAGNDDGSDDHLEYAVSAISELGFERTIRQFQHLSRVAIGLPEGYWSLVVHIRSRQAPSHWAKFPCPGHIQVSRAPLEQVIETLSAAQEMQDISRVALIGQSLMMQDHEKSSSPDGIDATTTSSNMTELVFGVLTDILRISVPNDTAAAGAAGTEVSGDAEKWIPLTVDAIVAEQLIEVMAGAVPVLLEADSERKAELVNSGDAILEVALSSLEDTSARNHHRTVKSSKDVIEKFLVPVISSLSSPDQCASVQVATQRVRRALWATAEGLLLEAGDNGNVYSSANDDESTTTQASRMFQAFGIQREQRGSQAADINYIDDEFSSFALLDAPSLGSWAGAGSNTRSTDYSRIRLSTEVSSNCFTGRVQQHNNYTGDLSERQTLTSEVDSICIRVDKGQCASGSHTRLSSNISFLLPFRTRPTALADERFVCGWFDPDTQSWSTEGCQTAAVLEMNNRSTAAGPSPSLHRTIRCSCSHLTDFAVLAVMYAKGEHEEAAQTLDEASMYYWSFAGINMYALLITLRQCISGRKAIAAKNAKFTFVTISAIMCVLCVCRLISMLSFAMISMNLMVSDFRSLPLIIACITSALALISQISLCSYMLALLLRIRMATIKLLVKLPPIARSVKWTVIGGNVAVTTSSSAIVLVLMITASGQDPSESSITTPLHFSRSAGASVVLIASMVLGCMCLVLAIVFPVLGITLRREIVASSVSVSHSTVAAYLSLLTGAFGAVLFVQALLWTYTINEAAALFEVPPAMQLSSSFRIAAFMCADVSAITLFLIHQQRILRKALEKRNSSALANNVDKASSVNMIRQKYQTKRALAATRITSESSPTFITTPKTNGLVLSAIQSPSPRLAQSPSSVIYGRTAASYNAAQHSDGTAQAAAAAAASSDTTSAANKTVYQVWSECMANNLIKDCISSGRGYQQTDWFGVPKQLLHNTATKKNKVSIV